MYRHKDNTMKQLVSTLKGRLSYVFNNLYTMKSETRVINITLNLGDPLCKKEVGLLQRE